MRLPTTVEPESAAPMIPRHVQPMLASSRTTPFDNPAFGFEFKWDGLRAMAHCHRGRLRLENRSLTDITPQYPDIETPSRQLGPRQAIIDGEIVAPDEDGLPDFELLQRRMHVTDPEDALRRARDTPVRYFAFDLLWLDGRPLLGEPYVQRRQRLEALDLSSKAWQTPRFHVEKGRAVQQASLDKGLEGTVAKRLDSLCEPGVRSLNWMKIKNHLRQDFVVGGWTAGEGPRRSRFGSLLVGVHDDAGRLRYAGRVGTGFGDVYLEDLAARLASMRRPTSPFDSLPSDVSGPFVEPRLVVEVEFAGWTRAGRVRAGVYKGLRRDKQPAQVVREVPPRRSG